MIAIYKDTNAINANQQDNFVNDLEELVEKYPDSLMFEKTDVLDTELLQNPIHNSKRLKKSEGYVESFGTMVLGYSRWNHAVWGENNDDKKLGEMLRIIFGTKKRNEYTKNEIRDTMHILTTMKHGGNYFITYDKKLLAKSAELFKLNNATTVCTPEDCLIKVKDRLQLLGKI